MWFQKKSGTKNELQLQVTEINEKLQQVIEENKRLQNDVRNLQENVKQKEQLLEREKKRYKVYEGMLLSAEQSAVVELLENTDNCYFITGKAGTGKSTILSYFIISGNTRFGSGLISIIFRKS